MKIEPPSTEEIAEWGRLCEQAGSSNGTNGTNGSNGAAHAYLAPVFDLGSDVEIATATLARLQGEHGGHAPVFTRGEFYSYDETRGIFSVVERHRLERIVHTFDGAAVGEKGRLKVVQKVVTGSLARAAAIVADVSFFDTAAPGIAFKNCFVRVSETGIKQVPHAPEHRATVNIGIDYVTDAPRNRFEKALAEILGIDTDGCAKTALIQEYAGACLIAVATRYQTALILVGGGANGKSVLLAIIGALFPSAAVVSIPPQDFGQEYRRAMLAGARINLVNEIPEREVLDSEAFKAIIAGDLIIGRKIREPPFSFRPVAGHWFAGNHLPGTADQSHGFFRRLLPISLDRTFLKHEQDTQLAHRIIVDELAGVAAWALSGAERLLKQGHYTLPASAVYLRDEWKESADQVRLFASESVRDSASSELSGSALYALYGGWARTNGHRLLASNRFAERMQAIGFTKRHTSNGSRWHLEVNGVKAADE